MSRTASPYTGFREVWEVLVRAAAQQQTLTYGELAELLGGPSAGYIPRGMGKWLNPIAFYCDQHGLPRLTDSVVNQQSTKPGYQAPPGYDFLAARKAIYAFDWHALSVTPSDLVKAGAARQASKRP